MNKALHMAYIYCYQHKPTIITTKKPQTGIEAQL